MAANLTHDDVRRVAALAHLSLTDMELEMFVRQLGDILDWAAAIQAADVSGVEPWTRPGAGPGAPLRDDDVIDAGTGRAALEGAPDASPDAGLFRVPTVF